MRKHDIGVSNQVWHKQGYSATEDCYGLEIYDAGSKGICTIYEMKLKALIIFKKKFFYEIPVAFVCICICIYV